MKNGVKICKVEGTIELKHLNHVFVKWWMNGYHVDICKYCDILLFEDQGGLTRHELTEEIPAICLSDEEKIIKDLLE